MEATVRKNFVFERNIAEYLEELARESKKSMTALVQEMIEERYKQIKVKKRMRAFNRIKGSATGLLTDTSIQEIKANREL
jgi:predicted DNA-binding ribbon-helix-helix protein